MMRTLWILLVIFLCSCVNQKMTPDQQGFCKEVKRRIIFNGATSNNIEATQQRAELNTLNKNYNSHDCN
ncbi:MAG: hypothetical protein ACD_60C00100G0001 [uncultured bacterium]|nr:MAG: hypothetical protein ACD_60C00100G0001 [uncultured bacterium]